MHLANDPSSIIDLGEAYRKVGRVDDGILYFLLGYYLDRSRKDALVEAAKMLAGSRRRKQAAELLAGAAISASKPERETIEKAICEAANWDQQKYEQYRRGLEARDIEQFFYFLKSEREDAELAVWLCGFTNKIEFNLTASFSEHAGHDLLILCLPVLKSYLDLNLNRSVYAALFEFKPALLVLFSCGLTQIEQNVTPALIGFAKEKLGFKLICLWIDMAKPLSKPLLQSYAPYADAIVACDSQVDRKVESVYPEKCISLWHVVNEDALRDRGEEKDIDVSFIGQVTRNYSGRQPYIEKLQAMGLKVFVGGKDLGRYVSHEKYAEVMRRSKIVLNFSEFSITSIWDYHPITEESISGGWVGHHIKGRVYEVLHSGAVLLESANEEIKSVLEPNTEYVEYHSVEDMEAKILELVGDERRRQTIGEAGRKLALGKFTSKLFWERILTTAGMA